MKEGKRSLVIALLAFFVTVFGLATEVQARPHHGHHRAAAHYARTATAQPECNDLFGNCSTNTANSTWDTWQGYTNTQQPVYRRSRHAVRSNYAQPQASEDAWGSSSSHSGVMSTAQSMMGMSERGNRGALARTLGVDPARTPWCAAWANAVLRRNGYRTSGSNMARSFYSYGARSSGEVGDIAVMPHHVGFVAGYSYRHGRRYVGVLAGNTSNRVKTAWYPASRVAFRDPN
jgi:uncharacterized protein (TIGR02594 family)